MSRTWKRIKTNSSFECGAFAPHKNVVFATLENGACAPHENGVFAPHENGTRNHLAPGSEMV